MGRPAKALTIVRWSVGSNPTLSAIVMLQDMCNARTLTQGFGSLRFPGVAGIAGGLVVAGRVDGDHPRCTCPELTHHRLRQVRPGRSRRRSPARCAYGVHYSVVIWLRSCDALVAV